MMIAVLAFLLPVAGIAQCAGTSCDGQCAGTSCDDEGSPVSLLQVKVSTVAKKKEKEFMQMRSTPCRMEHQRQNLPRVPHSAALVRVGLCTQMAWCRVHGQMHALVA